ncbi:MAG: DUF2306 domain-containing protein [Bacteroidota bacterium]
MKRKNLLISFLLIGALSMMIMSFRYFVEDNAGILNGKVIKEQLWYKITFLIHIAMGILAIATGPIQFIDPILRRAPWLHKIIGYGYSLGVLLSGCSGLIIAQYAMGGIITSVGFSSLAIIWLGSLFMALKNILQGKVAAHKAWMTINYALTFSSITQRTILLFAFIPSFSFIVVYQISAWLCWLFNIGVACYIISRDQPWMQKV